MPVAFGPVDGTVSSHGPLSYKIHNMEVGLHSLHKQKLLFAEIWVCVKNHLFLQICGEFLFGYCIGPL